MKPAIFKVGQTVKTPHGIGKIIDATPHRLSPEDEPSVWLYGVKFDSSLEVSVSNQLPFLESELVEANTSGQAAAKPLPAPDC